MSPVLCAADVKLKSVLVAFDFSGASKKPLCHALAIAEHYGARFHLAHVVAPSIGFMMAGSDSFALANVSRLRETCVNTTRSLGIYVAQRGQ
jgi:nucleotide-binding universal stress UspA family protein